MKHLVYLLIATTFSGLAMANDVTASDELDKPGVELVVTIHNFCLEQYSEQDDPDMENYILGCVNTDLETSAYRPFKSYSELQTFITPEREE